MERQKNRDVSKVSKVYLVSASPKRNPGWTLFREILSDYEKRFAAKFHVEGRKIALIIDNCPDHSNVDNIKAIELVFLPPSTTSKSQPMDQAFNSSGATQALDISKVFNRVWHAGLGNRWLLVVLNGNF